MRGIKKLKVFDKQLFHLVDNNDVDELLEDDICYITNIVSLQNPIFIKSYEKVCLTFFGEFYLPDDCRSSIDSEINKLPLT